MLRPSWGYLLGLFATLAIVLDASADSCGYVRPDSITYLSSNGIFRFTFESAKFSITPSESQPSTAAATAGPTVERITECRGLLERKQDDGTYRDIWTAPLRNRISPGGAVVSDDGDFVATFDDDCSMGFGRNVVSIYSGEGKLIREFSLLDFLTKAEISELSSSFSNIYWGRGHYFDSSRNYLLQRKNYLALRIFEGSNAFFSDDASFREVRIELPSARVDRPKALLEDIAAQGDQCKALDGIKNPSRTCLKDGAAPLWCSICMDLLGK
jgi:hypothetical protein